MDVLHKLYRSRLSENSFTQQLQEIIYPVYKAVLNLGFDRWTL